MSYPLPKVPWNWYWHIQVTSGPGVHINIYLKRKTLGVFRIAIDNTGSEYIILKPGEDLTAERKQEVVSRANKIYEARFDQGNVIDALRNTFPKAKIGKR